LSLPAPSSQTSQRNDLVDISLHIARRLASHQADVTCDIGRRSALAGCGKGTPNAAQQPRTDCQLIRRVVDLG
jgi:hypothetical protein